MRTISQPITLSGMGIHTGAQVSLTIRPVDKPGLSFSYGGHTLPVLPEYTGLGHVRSTQLSDGTITIQTPEHVLSACYALSLDGVDMTLTHYECPIMDGSAMPFIEAILPYMVETGRERPVWQVPSDLVFKHNDSLYVMSPSDAFSIHAVVSYPNHWIQTMSANYVHDRHRYIQEIAPARTYGFTHEIDQLKQAGLAKGGSLDNALVITDSGYMNEPRFLDEPVRHKILDFMGDFAISPYEFKGHFVLIKPSHAGNIACLNYLLGLIE